MQQFLLLLFLPSPFSFIFLIICQEEDACDYLMVGQNYEFTVKCDHHCWLHLFYLLFFSFATIYTHTDRDVVTSGD